MASAFDAVVIGSGIGGLTAGAFMARAGMKVLVLERHSKIGGYAHGFKRRAHVFESAIHSVPMAQNGTIRHLLRLLDVDHMIEPIELPEMYRVDTPDFSFTMPSREEEIYSALASLAPGGTDDLRRLRSEWDSITENILTPVFKFEDTFLEEDRNFVSRYHNLSYREHVCSLVESPAVRQALFGQWPYGGGAPEFGGSLFYLVMFLLHLHEGTHTMKGGFGTLADALAHAIVSRGGEVRTKSEVTEVIPEGKRVRAVGIAGGEEFEARIFVSNVSPYLLHKGLIAKERRNRLALRRLGNLSPSVSSVVVYLGMNPAFTGRMKNNTVFWFATSDFARVHQNIADNVKGPLDHLILLASMEGANGRPTLTLMNFVRPSYAADWKTEKMRMADEMVRKAAELYPGLEEFIETREVGSPATLQRYTGNTGGALYGFENTHEMYGEAKLPVRTHLSNLYQAGHWGKPGGGVLNVMTNGYIAYHVMAKEHL